MKIYTVLQRGEYHLNQCEDYYFTGHIGKDILVCAVMDGCTMGVDSYFASTLAGKLLRKTVKNMDYKEWINRQPLFANAEGYLEQILRELFSELVVAKNQLALEKNELLTTLLILVINKKENNGIVLVVGDGVVCINGNIYEFDQDNKPDYIGYHLSEAFDDWYGGQQQKIQIDTVIDVSIATDGILTFTLATTVKTQEDIVAERYLLLENITNEDEDILERRLKQLEHIQGKKPTDDLVMIRVVF